MNYIITTTDGETLQHHGILGQKWGVTNGPPYPLDAEDHNANEIKEGYKKSLNGHKNAQLYERHRQKEDDKGADPDGNSVQNAKKATKVLGINENESEKVRKMAKVLKVSLATAAGVAAVGYAYACIKGGNWLSLQDINISLRQSIVGFNADGSSYRRTIGDIASGEEAIYNRNGYRELIAGNNESLEEYLSHVYNNPFKQNDRINLSKLVRNVRNNQILSGDGGVRRLSCWSASNAYYLSRMTGKDFCSRSFENLVDFRDFGQLYKNPPIIRNIDGKIVKSFVGKFGAMFKRCDETSARKLCEEIVRNTTNTENLTVGFINAGYHGCSCTHQWNYEISHNKLRFIDGYSGDIFNVGYIIDGKLEIEKGAAFSRIINELHHYNRDSIRFYAPKLEDLNIQEISKIVLARIM